MKRFLIKISLFILITLIGFLAIISLAHETTDPFYIRFTTPQQENLILGTSRAAQGIQPQELQNILNKPFFNYSFTLKNSPYGKVYLESIKKKLNPKTSDGIFILCVSPWSISSISEDPNDESMFRENDSFLADMTFTNTKPNLEYLLKHFSGKFIDILKGDDRMILHKDGWLEININLSKAAIAKRTASKVKQYTNDVLPVYKLSSKRIEYLNLTINYLKEHGQVYLVRLPVGEGILNIEKTYTNDFDKYIQSSIEASNGYLDLTPHSAEYTYTDGNHLSPESGKQVTKNIGEWILNQN